MSVTFNNEIRLGDVLLVLAFMASIIGAYYALRAKIVETNANVTLLKETHGLRLDYIDAALEDAKVELKSSATQDMHITQLRRELDELKHWKGFVTPDGEYDRSGTRKPFTK